jgi:prepilin-type N-terminal cleavage/methylation domain-containing protein
MWRSRPAFTLIELMIVIALICVIVTLAMINSSFVDRFAVRSEVEKFATTCRYLRELAMSTNTEQRLVFDLKNNSYSFVDPVHHPLPGPAEGQSQSSEVVQKLSPRVQFGVGKRAVSGPPSAPTKPITHAVTYINNAILFYPDGIIQAGIVYFSDVASKFVYAVSTPVSQISFVRTYVYDGTWTSLNSSGRTDSV